MLHDSIPVTFLKWQNYRDEQINGYQSLETWGKGVEGEEMLKGGGYGYKRKT